ncbi:drug/metabolite transporter (DMT)-like permease [Chryseobacterium bernardetii]|jgi:drug/metabolite transporter (DMT)-like permease|uniref:Drug/metabolite transporter (DMT)-like permease n=3 Tax=Chryseobacterium TaxID=59732 RepID=A0ACC6IZC6_9FLAO|nr:MULTISPECIES: EamA family transporter [Chryseobacterium]MDR6371653.1 drug/metabolite transporter (DMT)-like permease [Chryseobacterium vietnamense]MDR6443141.1 drug/metabolite transporter (DMT)-like permease [Chryseobacterium bernardetii]MDR6460620.1 drug/metabolite transporter (DMT)-like permease [Chryseobacterium vietnamense]MDR6488700.1 drug/metabolite transporter (DMT)-like permease [Chryseobacterium vietnamense]TQM18071.1 putative membrane protein [Chryseobacterium aquifrigidense]
MHKLALFRLHLIVFLWGFTAILGKLIQANAQILVFYRMLFASVFLYLFIRIFKKESIKVSKKIFFQLAAIGFAMALHWYCFFYSIKVSNVSIALSCLSLSTLFASILEPIIFKRKIDVSEVLMGTVIVACILLIFKTEFHFKEGIMYGILCAIFGTVFSVFNGKMFGKTSSGNIIFYEIFCGWFILMIFYLLSGQIFQMNEINYRDLALICLLASVFTAFPMLESVNLMKYISPFTLILTVNLEPVYGIILAFFIFGESEHMSPIFYIASGVMILAIIANGLIKARKTKNLN